MTLVCVTPEMGFARQLARRVIFRDQGKMVEEGTPAGFFSTPKTAPTGKCRNQMLSHGFAARQ